MKIILDKETGIRTLYTKDGNPTRLLVLPGPRGGWCIYDNSVKRIIVTGLKKLSEANRKAKAMV